jgi:hypothetical protein
MKRTALIEREVARFRKDQARWEVTCAVEVRCEMAEPSRLTAPVNRVLRDACLRHSSARRSELAQWKIHSIKTEVHLRAQTSHLIQRRIGGIGIALIACLGCV